MIKIKEMIKEKIQIRNFRLDLFLSTNIRKDKEK